MDCSERRGGTRVELAAMIGGDGSGDAEQLRRWTVGRVAGSLVWVVLLLDFF